MHAVLTVTGNPMQSKAIFPQRKINRRCHKEDQQQIGPLIDVDGVIPIDFREKIYAIILVGRSVVTGMFLR